MQIFKGVASGKQSFREHCATKWLLEANPRNISASKISRYTVVLVVSLLGEYAKTEINVGLTKIELFGSSLRMTTIPSASKLFFLTFWELFLSYPSISPCS